MLAILVVENFLCVISMIVLALAMVFCLIRAILGPRVADRVISINLIGTKTIISIVVLAFYLKEEGLIDVAIVYALMSFLAVVVLVNIFLFVYNKNKGLEKKDSNSKKADNKDSAITAEVG